MKRRTTLAALGAATVAFAGCLADGSGDPSDGINDDDDERTEDSTDEGGDGSVLAQFDGEPTRPECERESETVTVEFGGDETREYETPETIPYPDSPTAFTEDAVVEFVDAFERAYVAHNVLCERRGSGRVLEIHYGVRTSETFDRDDDVTAVFLLRAGAAGTVLHEDGTVSVADVGYGGVVYGVDETGVARADFADAGRYEGDAFEPHAPDPLEEGELVAAFD